MFICSYTYDHSTYPCACDINLAWSSLSIPIIARMNGCHDVWAQLHMYSHIFATIVSICHVICSCILHSYRAYHVMCIMCLRCVISWHALCRTVPLSCKLETYAHIASITFRHQWYKFSSLPRLETTVITRHWLCYSESLLNGFLSILECSHTHVMSTTWYMRVAARHCMGRNVPLSRYDLFQL